LNIVKTATYIALEVLHNKKVFKKTGKLELHDNKPGCCDREKDSNTG
jgi:hypothetical protein